MNKPADGGGDTSNSGVMARYHSLMVKWGKIRRETAQRFRPSHRRSQRDNSNRGPPALDESAGQEKCILGVLHVRKYTAIPGALRFQEESLRGGNGRRRRSN